MVPVSDDIEFKVVRDRGFYRLPAEKGSINPTEYPYIAVYRSSPHKQIDHFARIKRVRIVQGKELDFGRYSRHFGNYKKGRDNYERHFFKIECGALIQLSKPVINKTGQGFRSPRITTFEKLLSSNTLEDLRAP